VTTKKVIRKMRKNWCPSGSGREDGHSGLCQHWI